MRQYGYHVEVSPGPGASDELSTRSGSMPSPRPLAVPVDEGGSAQPHPLTELVAVISALRFGVPRPLQSLPACLRRDAGHLDLGCQGKYYCYSTPSALNERFGTHRRLVAPLHLKWTIGLSNLTRMQTRHPTSPSVCDRYGPIPNVSFFDDTTQSLSRRSSPQDRQDPPKGPVLIKISKEFAGRNGRSTAGHAPPWSLQATLPCTAVRDIPTSQPTQLGTPT